MAKLHAVDVPHKIMLILGFWNLFTLLIWYSTACSLSFADSIFPMCPLTWYLSFASRGRNRHSKIQLPATEHKPYDMQLSFFLYEWQAGGNVLYWFKINNIYVIQLIQRMVMQLHMQNALWLKQKIPSSTFWSHHVLLWTVLCTGGYRFIDSWLQDMNMSV